MNKAAILGIIDVVLYIIIVTLFLIIKSDLLLTLFEAVTFLSAPIMLLILLDILNRDTQVKPIFKTFTVVFMTCTIALTTTAHLVNITVTRRLIAEGIDIPTYFQIGYWPSIEMTIDYLAWGFFMGLAFITTSLALQAVTNAVKKVKTILLVCGSLCLLGFAGTVLINENIWYLAPLGYGIGTMVLCIVRLADSKQIK